VSNEAKTGLQVGSEHDRLAYACQLYQRFCIDLAEDTAMARTRLIAGIQIGMREARYSDFIEPAISDRQTDNSDLDQMSREAQDLKWE